MRIGTTPTHEFFFPVPVSAVADVELTYKQGDAIVLQKYLKDLTTTEESAVFKFTEEDTFKFKTKPDVLIQVRAISPAGDVLASDIFRISAQECLSDKMLTGRNE